MLKEKTYNSRLFIECANITHNLEAISYQNTDLKVFLMDSYLEELIDEDVPSLLSEMYSFLSYYEKPVYIITKTKQVWEWWEANSFALEIVVTVLRTYPNLNIGVTCREYTEDIALLVEHLRLYDEKLGERVGLVVYFNDYLDYLEDNHTHDYLYLVTALTFTETLPIVDIEYARFFKGINLFVCL